jgi:hypothetical protein
VGYRTSDTQEVPWAGCCLCTRTATLQKPCSTPCTRPQHFRAQDACLEDVFKLCECCRQRLLVVAAYIVHMHLAPTSWHACTGQDLQGSRKGASLLPAAKQQPVLVTRGCVEALLHMYKE